MKKELILDESAQILSQEERLSYFDNGYVVAKSFLEQDWLSELRKGYQDALDRSRQYNDSNDWFSLDSQHTQDSPRVTRIEKLADQDPVFWDFAKNSQLADLGSDVLGPDVVYRDSMINVKCPGQGGAVKWHQDFPFYPHTNTGTIQILIALYDIPMQQGPLQVVRGSHHGPIFEHYDDLENWTGQLKSNDVDSLDNDNIVTLTCDAGDAIVLHPLTVHSSGPNNSEFNRPLLIHGLSAADARSYTPMTWGNSHTGELVRGKPARYSHHEALCVRLPPDWSEGYTSIFEHHNKAGRN